jgi:hypothetical protein
MKLEQKESAYEIESLWISVVRWRAAEEATAEAAVDIAVKKCVQVQVVLALMHYLFHVEVGHSATHTHPGMNE